MRVRRFFRNLFFRERIEGELERELQATLDILVDEKMRSGASPAEARRLAMIELGGTEQIRENVRFIRAGRGFNTIVRQVRYAFRLLRKSPVFTAVAVLTLALGIGVNTAMFTIVNAVLLQPLPYRNAAELVLLSSANDNRGYSGMPLPPGAYFDFRSDPNAFVELAAFSDGKFTVSMGAEPVSVPGLRASHNMFELLGAVPAVGRTFSADEDSPAGANVVVLSYGFWQRYYSGRQDITGQALTLDGVPHTIIGVMPQGFAFPSKETAVWLPLRLNEADPQWGTWFLTGVGRMRPGATLQSTASALAAGAQRFAKNLPFGDGWRFEVVDLTDHVIGEFRPALRLLFGAVGLVLLIACVNVSSLLFARTRARRKELAMRAALGSSRSRIVSDLLIENAVLALVGGLAGAAFAAWAVVVLKGLLPAGFPRLDEIHVNLTVWVFAAFLSLGCGLISAILPAFRSSRVDLLDSLKGENVPAAHSFIGGAGMIAMEVALSVLVVASASLLVRSFERLMEVPMGFNPAGVVSLPVALPPARYRPVDQRLAFGHALLDRAEAAIGKGAVALTTSLPTRGTQMMEDSFVIDADGRMTISQSLGIDAVSPGYFEVMGIPLLRGRSFNNADTPAGMKVVIVNQAVARTFPNGDAVGRRMLSSDDKTWYSIVGVVGDVKQNGPENETPMQAYLPFDQAPSLRFQLASRTGSDGERAIASLKAAVREADSSLPVGDVSTLSNIVSEAMAGRRLNALLMSGFGLLAIVLASAGVYGVAEFAGAGRKRELGVRMALGAGHLEILRLLLGQTLSAAAAGVLAGTIIAIGVSRYFDAIVFGIPSTDPVALAFSAAIMLFMTFLAAYLPARRALNSDPVRTLRAE